MLLADPKTGAGNTSHQRGSDRACGERSAARIGAALIYSLWAARCFLLFPTVISLFRRSREAENARIPAAGDRGPRCIFADYQRDQRA